MREYSKGFVQKDKGQWKTVLSWQEDGRHRKRSKVTGVRCYPDQKDARGNLVKRDNRGKGAAEDFLHRWRDQVIKEERESARPAEGETSEDSTMSLYEYARNYFDLLHVKPSTKAGYRAAIVRLAGTTAGACRLCDLRASVIYAWEKSMYDDGLAENTVAHYHAFLSQVLRHAVGEGDLGKSPLDHMRAPRRRPKPVNTLTKEGVSSVINAVRSLYETTSSHAGKTREHIAFCLRFLRHCSCAQRYALETANQINLTRDMLATVPPEDAIDGSGQAHAVDGLNPVVTSCAKRPLDLGGCNVARCYEAQCLPHGVLRYGVAVLHFVPSIISLVYVGTH